MLGSRARWVILAVLALTLAGALGAQAKTPPPPDTKEIKAGHVPHVCAEGEAKYDTGATNGVYWSKRSKAWISAPLCYVRWGNLEATGAGVVAAGGRFTVTAIPNGGSNSAQYAPETKSITWQFPGKRVAGCGNADLSCTVVAAKKATKEWQWFQFQVSMPRTFFVDSRGSNCAGQHLCAGFTTHAWSYVGIPPKGQQPPSTISGVVLDAEKKPVAGVKVKADGKKNKTATTDAAGAYSMKVSKGEYTVSASGPYCVVGEKGCKRKRSVKVPGDKTVNFGPVPEHTLSGLAERRLCGKTCRRLPLDGIVIRATPEGGGKAKQTTTAADGTFSLELPEGDYKVAPASAKYLWDPRTKSVELTKDRNGVVFVGCRTADATARAAKAPSGPGPFHYSATIPAPPKCPRPAHKLDADYLPIRGLLRNFVVKAQLDCVEVNDSNVDAPYRGTFQVTATPSQTAGSFTLGFSTRENSLEISGVGGAHFNANKSELIIDYFLLTGRSPVANCSADLTSTMRYVP